LGWNWSSSLKVGEPVSEITPKKTRYFLKLKLSLSHCVCLHVGGSFFVCEALEFPKPTCENIFFWSSFHFIIFIEQQQKKRGGHVIWKR
jgi:hypothetical protein